MVRDEERRDGVKVGQQLSAAAKDYLSTIYELDSGNGVRSVDVANQLGVSKPSVNKAIRMLSQQGYLMQERYAQIQLTPQGIQTAKEIQKKEEIVRLLLEDVFGLEEEPARRDAKRISQVIEQRTFDKMRMYLNNFHYNN